MQQEVAEILGDLVNTESSGSSDVSSTVGVVIAVVLALVISAVFGFLAWRRGKELARLKHEEALRDEEAHQADVDDRLASKAEEAARAQSDLQDAEEALEELQSRLERLRKIHEESHARIDEIRDWSHVDDYVDRRRDDGSK